MKRGEKILLGIGLLWSMVLALLFLVAGLAVGLDELLHPRNDIQVFVVYFLLPLIWTIVGLIWIFVYGRRE